MRVRLVQKVVDPATDDTVASTRPNVQRIPCCAFFNILWSEIDFLDFFPDHVNFLAFFGAICSTRNSANQLKSRPMTSYLTSQLHFLRNLFDDVIWNLITKLFKTFRCEEADDCNVRNLWSLWRRRRRLETWVETGSFLDAMCVLLVHNSETSGVLPFGNDKLCCVVVTWVMVYLYSGFHLNKKLMVMHAISDLRWKH